jgi:phage replication-related protein YjqB (UPF0714/DUF867 family)
MYGIKMEIYTICIKNNKTNHISQCRFDDERTLNRILDDDHFRHRIQQDGNRCQERHLV